MAQIPHYLRLKPRDDAPESKDKEYLIESQTEKEVKFKDTLQANKFSRVFQDNDSQVTVYDETLKDITMGLFEGHDGVLFTLGPSNSGKSYTLLGNISNPGISIYALNDIFKTISDNFADHKLLKHHFGESLVVPSKALPQKESGLYAVSLSVFEIYNDKIRDLSMDSSKTQNQSLDIVTDSKDGKIKPSKVRQIYVSQIEDAKLVLHKSIKRRAVSPTSINKKSSRSHLFIHLNLHMVVNEREVKTSRLTISDLAGSERTKAARTAGKEFKEGNYTNQSLSELGRILTMMQSTRFDSSVLRTSKLTRLLLTDLFRSPNVHNKLKIILALDPYSDLSTVLHTLRYIQPVSKVPLSERSSMELSQESIQISKLSEEIEALKRLNQALKADNELADEKLMELEIELRQELFEEYEKKIQELDIIHTKALNEARESSTHVSDKKLKLLSEDYEQRINELKNSYEKRITNLKDDLEGKIEQLEQQNDALIKDYGRDAEKLENAQSAALAVDALKKEIEDLKRERLEKEQSLLDEITSAKRGNEELHEKLTKMEEELRSFQKKDKKKSKKISELSTQLEKKRNSNALENDGDTTDFKKFKPTGLQNKDEQDAFDEQESELTSFSPIILSQGALVSSPSKHPIKMSLTASPTKSFKSIETPMFPHSVSPKKSKSPLKNNNSKTPSRKALKEINLDVTVPLAAPKMSLSKSPIKSPLKSSPSKKKKIRGGYMVTHDDSF